MKNKYLESGYNYIITVLIFLILASALLSFSTATRDLGLVKTFFAHLFILLLLGCVLLRRLHFPEYTIRFNIFLKAFLIFIVYICINLIIKVCTVNYTIYPSAIEELSRFIFYFLIVFSVINGIFEYKYLKLLFYGLIFITFIVIIFEFGFFQWLGIDLHLIPAGYSKSTFGNPNFYAGFIVLINVFLLSQILINKNYLIKLLSAGMFVILIYHLVLSQSRGGWLGVPASIFVFVILFFFIFNKNKKVKKRFLQVCSGAVIIILAALLITGKINTLIKTIKFKYSVSYGSGKMRVHTYLASMQGIRNNFVFGNGIGTYQTSIPFYRNAQYLKYNITNNQLHNHNEYLEHFFETGILGIGLFLFFLLIYYIYAFYILNTVDVFKFKIIIVAVLSAVTGTLIHNIFSVNLRFSSTAILFYFMISLPFVFENLTITNNRKYLKPEKPGFSYITIFLLTIILFIGLTKIYYNQFQCNKELQKATSYEREDSKFYISKTVANSDIRYMYLLDIYSKANKYNPYDLGVYYKISNVYYRLADVFRDPKRKFIFISIFKQYLTENPFPGGHELIDFDYVDCYKKSLEYYSILKKYAPGYANMNYNISLCYFNLKKYMKSLFYIKQELLINLDAKNFKHLINIYKTAKLNSDLFELYRKDLIANPDDISARLVMAYLYYSRKKYYQAIEQYLEITNTYKNKFSPAEKFQICESYKNIGVVYQNKIKNIDKALYYYKKYLSLTNNQEEKIKIQRLVQQLSK